MTNSDSTSRSARLPDHSEGTSFASKSLPPVKKRLSEGATLSDERPR